MTVFNQKKSVSHTPISSVSPVVEHQSSLIGKTLLIKGEVISDDEVVIEGKIEGKINVKNRVVIGKNGSVEADVEAREIVIRGRVNGNVKGSYRVEIIPEGILNGNIQAPKVIIAEGAIFEGSIDMKPNADKTKSIVDERGGEFRSNPTVLKREEVFPNQKK